MIPIRRRAGSTEQIWRCDGAGLDNNIFISRYQLKLPDKDRLQAFIEDRLREVKEKEAEQD